MPSISLANNPLEEARSYLAEFTQLPGLSRDARQVLQPIGKEKPDELDRILTDREGSSGLRAVLAR